MLDELVKALVNQIGGTTILSVLVGFYLVDKLGLVKIFADKIDSSRKLKHDQQVVFQGWQNEFINKLRADIEDERKRREQDRREFEEENKRLDARIDELIADNANWRKDSSKWRHLAGNLAIYANRIRNLLIEKQLPVPRFNAWDKFLEEGGDPEEFSFDPESKEPERKLRDERGSVEEGNG